MSRRSIVTCIAVLFVALSAAAVAHQMGLFGDDGEAAARAAAEAARRGAERNGALDRARACDSSVRSLTIEREAAATTAGDLPGRQDDLERTEDIASAARGPDEAIAVRELSRARARVDEARQALDRLAELDAHIARERARCEALRAAVPPP